MGGHHYSLQAYCHQQKQGIKTKRHHVQVKVRGRAEPLTSMYAGSTQMYSSKGEMTPEIITIQTHYKMQEWIKQSITNTI